jgi:hypothetical protein
MSLSPVPSSPLPGRERPVSDGPLSMRPSALAGRRLAAELSRIGARLAEDVAKTPHLGALVRGTASKAVYVACLTQFYHHVGVTVRHLETAAATAAQARRIQREIAANFRAHALEERGHEKLAALDLRAPRRAGVAARRNPAFAGGRGVQGHQRAHRVLARPPSRTWGPAFVLEHLSARAAGEAEVNLREKSGIPGIGGALRFLHVHASADGGPRARVARLPLHGALSGGRAHRPVGRGDDPRGCSWPSCRRLPCPRTRRQEVSEDEEETWPLASW